jgi:hypothetical protein
VREQKEADTVELNMVELNLWSQPSCAVIPCRQGMWYAIGTGQVPV